MNQDLIALAKLRAEDLLAFFGINASVSATEDGNTIVLETEVRDSGRVIGHRGETLAALQQLINSMVKTQTTERIFVNLDISGYKKARAEQLAAFARSEAETVLTTGKEKWLREMRPAERRIVHMALSEIEGIETESEGEEPHRRIVIKKLEG